jgi:hydrogenase nickel incorporation protein HypA/HybF
MHEAGIVLSALDIAAAAARDAGATRIERLSFSIVPGGHVSADAVGILFLALSRGTMADGAVLEFERRVADRYCVECGRIYRETGKSSGCPMCGREGFLPPDLTDLCLTSIEVAD